jgi:cell division septation protein DedD/nucleoid DNA-binding protein
MEQYILDLIRENNRVIIPNLGAFIVAHEKGVTILFNNFLSFNDGLLVEYVMKIENIDRLDATDKINHYVERIKETLETSGRYELTGLGEFTKDASGILRFTQAEELNSSLFAGAKEESDEEENGELLDLESSPEEEVVEEAPKEEEIVGTQPEEEPEKETVSEIHSPGPEPASASDYEGSKEHETTTEEIFEEEKAKEKVALFIILFVLVPLIGFGIYYFFFSETEETNVKAKQEIVHKPVVPQVIEKNKKGNEIEAGPESTVGEPEVKPEPVKEPVKKKTVAASRRHFIIVGSFQEEANANKFVKTMRSKGFESPVTIPHNGMYLVGVESFVSLPKAMKRQEELLSKMKLENWILTVK